MGFVRATRSNTYPAFVKTSFISGAIYSIFSMFEVIWTDGKARNVANKRSTPSSGGSVR